MSADTQTIHGIKACLAVFDHRPHDILRIFYRGQVAAQLGAMLRWAASRRIVYRELDEEGMRKVAKSGHHEGLVLVTQPLCYGPLGVILEDEIMEEHTVGHTAQENAAAGAPPPGCWIAVDGVENPHNLGAILRTAAFYGLDGLLAGGAEPEARVNSAALRVAEGGAEFLQLCGARELAPVLAGLVQNGWSVVGLETDAPPLPGKPVSAHPWMLVVGHEHEGLSRAVRDACGAVFSIAGDGRLDSLNVSVATGIAISRLVTRAEEAGAKPPRPSRGTSHGVDPRSRHGVDRGAGHGKKGRHPPRRQR